GSCDARQVARENGGDRRDLHPLDALLFHNVIAFQPKTTAPRAFHVLLKPRGAICNLDCKYCFFLSKERLFQGSQFRMSDALLEDYTRQHIAAHHVPEVTFAWQGGEPTLMGLDFFRRAVALQEKYRKPGTRIVNTIQTNATTFNDEWCQFFHEQRFLVGI